MQQQQSVDRQPSPRYQVPPGFDRSLANTMTSKPEEYEMDGFQTKDDGICENPGYEDKFSPPSSPYIGGNKPVFGNKPADKTGLRWQQAVKKSNMQLPSSNPNFQNLVQVGLMYNMPVTDVDMDDFMEERRQRQSEILAQSPASNSGRRSTAKPRGSPGINNAAHKTLRAISGGFSQSGSVLTLGGRNILMQPGAKELNKAHKILKNMANNTMAMVDKKEKIQEIQGDLKELGYQGIKGCRLSWILFWSGIHSWFQRKTHEIGQSTLWASSIKKLAGTHGHHVGTYFVFLRWCFFINLYIGLMWLFFVITPYMVFYRFEEPSPYKVIDFTDDFKDHSAQTNVIGLFNGGGWLNASAYFIGSYNFPQSNYTTERQDRFAAIYDVKSAYLWVGLSYLIISFILIFAGIKAQIGKQLKRKSRFSDELPFALFTRYDYSLIQRRSVNIRRKEIINEMVMYYNDAEKQEAYREKLRTRFWSLMAKRIAINVIVVSILVGALSGVFYSFQAFSTSSNDILKLMPALILAMVNAACPFIFEILAELEEWPTPLMVIQLSILRSVVLRIVGFYVALYAIYVRRISSGCWENLVGQEMYTIFIIGSFVFEIITSGLIDMLLTTMYNRFPKLRGVLKTPAYFDSIKKTLELVYAQAVIWFGTPFCPLLPFVGCLRILVLFYLQKWSTMTWCKPKDTPFASKYSLPNMVWYLLLGAYIMALVPIGYSFSQLQMSGAYMNPDINEFADYSGEDQRTWHQRFVIFPDNDVLFAYPNCTTDSLPLQSLEAMDCQQCLKPQTTPPSYTAFCWNYFVYINGTIPMTGSKLVPYTDFCEACPPGCGPFRNQDSAYDTLITTYRKWPDGVQQLFIFLGTGTFTIILAFVLISILCIFQARANQRNKMLEKAELELAMERLDRRFIMRHYKPVDPESMKFNDVSTSLADRKGDSADNPLHSQSELKHHISSQGLRQRTDGVNAKTGFEAPSATKKEEEEEMKAFLQPMQI